MSISKADIIKENALSRDLLIQIILTAIFISLGTNLIVTSLSNLKDPFCITELILGIIILIISSIILIYLNFTKYDKKVILNGFLLYDQNKNCIYDIADYSFSNNSSKYLISAMNENESMKEIWENDSIKDFYDNFFIIPFNEYPRTNAKDIIEELMEYLLLEILSKTLSDYFQNSFLVKNLETYKREDIPDILLQNRFLNLFSMPMEERECFKNHAESNKHRNIEITRAFGKDGQMFKKFELILPKNTKITRLKPHKIRLKSSYMSIEINTEFTGTMSHYDSFEFRKYYLGLEVHPELTHLCGMHIRCINLKVTVDIKFKLRSLFSSTSWKYNKWLDYYIDGLDKAISADYFFESINWNQIVALVHVLNNKDAK